MKKYYVIFSELYPEGLLLTYKELLKLYKEDPNLYVYDVSNDVNEDIIEKLEGDLEDEI
tara:strand:+ start:4632 stop:4808 length:177 start_codon:yes stop_codon:yes gene_type:complete